MEKEQTTKLTNLLAKVTRTKPMVNYRIMPGGVTRIIDCHSLMYLVPIDKTNEFVLFDSGLNKEAKGLRTYLGHLGLGLSAIKEVFITHAHVDHVGGLAEIVEDSAAEVYIAGEEMAVFSGNKRSQGPLPNLLDVVSSKHNAAVEEVNPNLVNDGEFIKVAGGLAVRGIKMPGHTDGSMAWLISQGLDSSNSLIVGDSMDFDRRGLIRNAATPFTNNTNKSKNSINRLVGVVEQDLGVRVDNVIPSHSGEGRWGSVKLFTFNN